MGAITPRPFRRAPEAHARDMRRDDRLP
jgi:hypothetical protein